MHVVEVDVVDAEPLQRAFQRLAHVGGAVVVLAPPVGHPVDAELGRERDLRATAAVLRQKLADQRLAEAGAIDVRRVPEVDPEFQRASQRPEGLRLVSGPGEPCEAHAAEADRGNRRMRAKGPPLHHVPSPGYRAQATL